HDHQHQTAGVRLRRMIGNPLSQLDPFIFLDEFKSENVRDYGAGFPDHPHRGFEAITYMLAGIMEHKDHKGHHNVLSEGCAQIMTAGRGIVHSEMLKGDSNGLIWGFHLWINLPRKNKMMEPRYNFVPADKVPVVVDQFRGSRSKIICGEYLGQRGPIFDVVVNPIIMDVVMPPGTSFSIDLPSNHAAYIYVYRGSGEFGPITNPTSLKEPHMGIFECLANSNIVGSFSEGITTSCIEATSSEGCGFFFLSGPQIKEPIARHGPYVCYYSFLQV
ncbi:hypothetical protein SAMD00019534_014180, partial [Acytostelium subglobosum LB1]|uniref:hypothetical protein n=1 Tax=Acytostelium subglobosum LB1 TaxID=1410327 RepID=UPI000645041D